MNDLLNRRCLDELRLAGGERILDLGCGLGLFARAMARAAGPGGRVVAIERSPAQIARARRLAADQGEATLVDLRRGDATDPPLRRAEWGSFDVVHARFLLEHVPDPDAVVRVMLRAARPGGRIVLADDDHDVMRLHPEPRGFRALWEAYIRAFERNGNDPYVGRRLVRLLAAAGARPARNTWVFFGSASGAPDFAAIVANARTLLEKTRPRIVGQRLLGGAAFDAALRALRAFGRRNDAAFWYALCWAEGVRPPLSRGRARRPADTGPGRRAVSS
jgi:SAM-dependent methyltransferase